jgi:hypothetical protein
LRILVPVANCSRMRSTTSVLTGRRPEAPPIHRHRGDECRNGRFWPVALRHEQGAALNHLSQPRGRVLMHDVLSAGHRWLGDNMLRSGSGRRVVSHATTRPESAWEPPAKRFPHRQHQFFQGPIFHHSSDTTASVSPSRPTATAAYRCSQDRRRRGHVRP